MDDKKVRKPSIGEIVKLDGKLYKCVRDPNGDCGQCALNKRELCLRFECRREYREDNEDTYFEELNTDDYQECELSTVSENSEIHAEPYFIKKEDLPHIFHQEVTHG